MKDKIRWRDLERSGSFFFVHKMNWLMSRNEKASVTLIWVESISGTERILYGGRG